MKEIIEIDPDGRGGIYYEVYDKEHANPQNLDGWVGTFTKSELETYKKDCGKYVLIKIQEGETAQPAPS